MIGFALHAGDNDSFHYEFGEGVPACPTCGLVTQLDWINPTFQLRRTDLDISYTWDLAPIVSERFVDCSRAFPGGRFLPLPSAPGFALFIVDPMVPFDANRRRTTFEDRCPACGRFGQIAGADPVYLKRGTVLPRGFSRTDVEFGSTRERPDRVTAQLPRLLVDAESGTRSPLRRSPDFGSSRFPNSTAQPPWSAVNRHGSHGDSGTPTSEALSWILDRPCSARKGQHGRQSRQ